MSSSGAQAPLLNSNFETSLDILPDRGVAFLHVSALVNFASMRSQ